MSTKKIIVKEIFKSTKKEDIDKAIRDNIVKLIIRNQKRESKNT